MNIRLEFTGESEAGPSPALLMTASRDGMRFRAASSPLVGEVLSVTGQPNFRDEYTFNALVEETERHRDGERKLDYHEIRLGVKKSEESYPRFLKSLRKTCLEMNEDLRLLIMLPVEFSFSGSERRAMTENISYGGLFIRLQEKPLPGPGEPLSLSVFFPDREDPVTANGEVIYTVGGEEARLLGAQPGIGVRLLFEEDERLRWEDSLHLLHKKAFE